MRDLATLKGRVTVPAVLVAHHLPARRRGPCPVHGGDNPSAFQCDEERWHCWSHCGGGDVIDLVERLREVDTGSAIEWLANFAGLELGRHAKLEDSERWESIVREAKRAGRADCAARWHAAVEEYHKALDDLEMLEDEWRSVR